MTWENFLIQWPDLEGDFDRKLHKYLPRASNLLEDQKKAFA